MENQNKPPHIFGKVLRKARESKNMSKYAVAKASGRQISQIYLLEAGNSEPRVSTIIWLAQALGMRPQDLFNELCSALEQAEADSRPPGESQEQAQADKIL